MRIGINLLQFRPGETGGSEIYTRGIIGSLSEVDKKNEYVLICNSSNYKAITPPSDNFSIFVIPETPNKNFIREIPLLNKSGSISKKIESLKLDVIHFPFSFMFPLKKWEKSILTMYDLQHEYMPQNFSITQLVIRRKNYPESIKNSDLVIAISKFTKENIIEKYHTDLDKIIVNYIGYAKEFEKKDKEKKIKIKEKFNLSERYIFYPAATWHHKNHLKLLEAFRKIKREEDSNINLVFSGTKMNAQPLIDNKIKDLGLTDCVLQLGRLNFEDLVHIMQGAHVLAFPSLFEGFGIPVIEAMASRVPVACSNTTSLPEIAKGASIMFDPNDSNEIANAITRILNDNKLRKKLITKGNERIKEFTWKNIAIKTLRYYEKVAKI